MSERENREDEQSSKSLGAKFVSGVGTALSNVAHLAVVMLFIVCLLALVSVPPAWIWNAVTSPAVSDSGQTIIDGKYFLTLLVWNVLVVYPLLSGIKEVNSDE